MKKCILPWIHLEATATGVAMPCCLYKEKILIHGKSANFSEFSIREVWHSDYMENLRKDFLNGKEPVGCKICWETESIGKKSKRQVSNEQFKHHFNRFNEPLQNPVYLDLKLGTVCNLKCRTCSSLSSSKWIEDEIKLFGKSFSNNNHSYWIDEDSSVWKEIENLLPDIEHFDFTGGEPLLIKKHFEILKKCIDLGYSKNIKIHYNINGTVDITKKMFDIWNEFKSVELMFSIDGIKNKFEYLRNPGKWNVLIKNFESTLKNEKIYLSICYSVSVFNVMYMNEFIEWFKTYNLDDDKIYFNLIFNPEYLNIQNFTLHQKEQIKKYLEDTVTDHEWLNLKVTEIVDFMMNESLPSRSEEFNKNIEQLDLIRGENFQKVFPELAKILEE